MHDVGHCVMATDFFNPCMPLIIKISTLLLRCWDQKRYPTLNLSFYLNPTLNFSLFTTRMYFYASASGLNLGIWLGLSWCWKSFFHQVHEPRLVYWMIRGHGHPPGPHWANCHTCKRSPPTNQPATHQAWVNFDLSGTNQKNQPANTQNFKN